MKKRIIWVVLPLVALITVIVILFTVKGETDMKQASLSLVSLRRGHGSAFGNHFYACMSPSEIVYASYHPNREGEEISHDLIELYNEPITQVQWESIEKLLLELEPELKRDKSSYGIGKLIERLKPLKLDGGEFHELTIMWQNGDEEQLIEYIWPSSQTADELEKLIEETVRSVK